MAKKHSLVLGLIGLVAALGLFWFPQAIAQTTAPTPAATSFLQGRGIAQGSVFNRGRNANVSLTLDGDNFSLELTEPQGTNTRNRPLGRLQYRGAVVRRTNDPSAANSFSLNTRVRSFDSSDNLRIITNTTGTCRMEVFDARVVSSSCNTIADNSTTEFLGLEQF